MNIDTKLKIEGFYKMAKSLPGFANKNAFVICVEERDYGVGPGSRLIAVPLTLAYPVPAQFWTHANVLMQDYLTPWHANDSDYLKALRTSTGYAALLNVAQDEVTKRVLEVQEINEQITELQSRLQTRRYEIEHVMLARTVTKVKQELAISDAGHQRG